MGIQNSHTRSKLPRRRVRAPIATVMPPLATACMATEFDKMPEQMRLGNRTVTSFLFPVLVGDLGDEFRSKLPGADENFLIVVDGRFPSITNKVIASL
jgi:hypothetical protein